MWTTKDGHVLSLPEPRLRAITASLSPPLGPSDCPECSSRHIVADAASTAHFIGTLRNKATGQSFEVFRGHSGEQEVELITEIVGESEGEGEGEGEWGNRWGRWGGRHRHWRRWRRGRWGMGMGGGGDDDGGGGGDDQQESEYYRHYWPRRRILFARYPRWRRWSGRGYRPWYAPAPAYPYMPPPEPEPMPEGPPPPAVAMSAPGFGGGGHGRTAAAAPAARGHDDSAAGRGAGAGGGRGSGRGQSAAEPARGRAGTTGTEDGLPPGAGSASRGLPDPGHGRA